MTDLTLYPPTAVWHHFQTFLATPRPSGHEAAIREHLQRWADAQGLAQATDAAGNLLIRKPATPGAEHLPGVVLQGHLDMVAQKRRESRHDFLRDPVRAEVEGDWLVARDTTLGADNGIGASMALAVLEAGELPHPALEVLLTVDEETGMSGAQGLAPDWLQGTRLINLDTETWGDLYVGCAGGVDVNIRRPFARTPVPQGWVSLLLEIDGLQGGHSECRPTALQSNGRRLTASGPH